MTAIEPELLAIPAGCALLSVPERSASFSLPYRWPHPREVFVSAFYLGARHSTRAEYEIFLKETGHDHPVDWNDPALADAHLPVCGVSACDADAYVEWLRSVTGKPYRLPRADEWEYAARGGITGARFPWGDEPPDGRCCFGGSLADSPVPAGRFPANAFGLFDMVGNAWQWLAEKYADIADGQSQHSPPAGHRVLVGGSFMTTNTDCLWLAYRHDDPPDLRHRCLGFRLAL